MGVMELAVILELAPLDSLADLTVGVTERHTALHEVVHLLDRKGQAVARILHKGLLNLHILNGIGRDVQAIVHLIEKRKILLLEQLHIPEIAGRQIGGDQTQRILYAADTVAMGANQLEDVRILLVRHNARTRSHLVRQMYESEILARIEAAVERQAAERLCDGSVGGSNDAFRLSAAHLGIYDIVVEVVEAQQTRSQAAVQRGGRTVAGSRTERVAVHDLPGREKLGHISRQTLRVGPEPEAERRRHSHLEMGISRHQHIPVAFTSLLKQFEEALQLAHRPPDALPGKKLQVHQHLVIAGASRMDLLAYIPKAARKLGLHLGMHILHLLIYTETSLAGIPVEALQLRQQDGQLFSGKQPHLAEHSDVGGGAHNVVRGEHQVQFPVPAHRKAVYEGVIVETLIPDFSHSNSDYQ